MIQGTNIKNDNQAVDCLHQVARYVEQHIGVGKLSGDIRKVADRLHEVVKMEARFGKKNKPIPTVASAKHDEKEIYKNTISGKTHEG